MILKNKDLKKQICTLSKIDLNENVCKKCDNFQKENNVLKEEFQILKWKRIVSSKRIHLLNKKMFL